jgi:ubiquinone/menaquinone biosynthesis C-methylase UbiE
MDTMTGIHLSSYLKLLHRHRGEQVGGYDEVASIYDDFAKVWDQHIAAPALAHVNRLIEQSIKPGALVLDAGAGTGEHTMALLAHSQPGKIIALDASAGMLHMARSKIQDVRVSFIQGDVRHLPFADNTFDGVVSTWVIEIMDDPRAVVQEFIRVIKPNGIVISAFCSLPEGLPGQVLTSVMRKVSSKQSPLTHLLSLQEGPFHHCEFSSLTRFVGGLTTVAMVSKCCTVTEELVACKLPELQED